MQRLSACSRFPPCKLSFEPSTNTQSLSASHLHVTIDPPFECIDECQVSLLVRHPIRTVRNSSLCFDPPTCVERDPSIFRQESRDETGTIVLIEGAHLVIDEAVRSKFENLKLFERVERCLVLKYFCFGQKYADSEFTKVR